MTSRHQNVARPLYPYLLQRRGVQSADGRVSAMIVGAPSEAHARVYAADRHVGGDMAWGDDNQTTCVQIILADDVLHTLYNPREVK